VRDGNSETTRGPGAAGAPEPHAATRRHNASVRTAKECTLVAVRIAGVLLGGGASRRFGSPKLEAKLDGRRLVDLACGNFLDAGLEPVVFCGRVQPSDPRVVVVEAGDTMIDTLRCGLRAIGGGFAFAPADMPALSPELVRALAAAFEACGKRYLVPVHGGRRGHPAFARDTEAFFRLGNSSGAREVWREAGADLHHEEVATADILFDVDTPEDLAAAADEASRRARLIARGSL